MAREEQRGGFSLMLAIFPYMRMAAPIRQDSGRPHVLSPSGTEGLALIMTQPLVDITFSEADRAEVGSIVRNVYQEVLLELQGAERLRLAAGLPLPDEAAPLYAFLLPRQAVQR